MGRLKKQCAPTSSSLSQHIARQLLAFRQRDQLTMQQISEKSGLSMAFICEVENGQANLSVDTLWKLAKCFGITPQCFFDVFEG